MKRDLYYRTLIKQAAFGWQEALKALGTYGKTVAPAIGGKLFGGTMGALGGSVGGMLMGLSDVARSVKGTPLGEAVRYMQDYAASFGLPKQLKSRLGDFEQALKGTKNKDFFVDALGGQGIRELSKEYKQMYKYVGDKELLNKALETRRGYMYYRAKNKLQDIEKRYMDILNNNTMDAALKQKQLQSLEKSLNKWRRVVEHQRYSNVKNITANQFLKEHHKFISRNHPTWETALEKTRERLGEQAWNKLWSKGSWEALKNNPHALGALLGAGTNAYIASRINRGLQHAEQASNFWKNVGYGAAGVGAIWGAGKLFGSNNQQQYPAYRPYPYYGNLY